MKKIVDKHVPIDLSEFRDEPAGTALDALIKAARNNGLTSDEVAILVKESTSLGSDEHFWKVVCLYTDTPEMDNSVQEEDARCVRFGVSDIIVGPEDVPSKYAQILDENGKLLGEVEVYVIGYEDCEEG